MGCISPILIKDPRNLYIAGAPAYMQVPCGHCIGCLRKKQNDWSIRISEQLKQSTRNCFVTLTYSDEHLPLAFSVDGIEVRGSLCKSDYQKWLKHLRINLNRQGVSSPSFFVCGEYGSRTFRPHYHVVVCGATTQMIEKSLDYWRDRYGFVLSKDIGLSNNDRQAVGMYVGKYSSKGVFIEKSPLMRPFLEKPFCEASHFLGRKYIVDRLEYFSLVGESSHYNSFDDWCKDFSSNFVYRNGNFTYSLPNYYKKYFFNHVDGKGILDSVIKRTGFDPSSVKIPITKYGFTKFGYESEVSVFVPSFRDAIALSLQHLADSEYCDKLSSSDKPFNEVVRSLGLEELSHKDTLLISESRKLDTFYFKSKL